MVKGILKTFVDILYPKICLSCNNPLEDNAIDGLLCLSCWSKIKKNIFPLCAVCGRQIREKQINKRICHKCQRGNFSFDRVLSPCIYEGVICDLIHKFKYQNKEQLKVPLGKLLIEFIYKTRVALNLFDLVMPIPLHKIRLREREFNQAELLASQVAKEFSLNLSSSNLWRKHQRQPQMELKQEQRWDNIKGCFSLNNHAEVKGKNIILVDDVLTTGATCSEAALVLKDSGANSVFVLTLAN